jgi:hypothetical protein
MITHSNTHTNTQHTHTYTYIEEQYQFSKKTMFTYPVIERTTIRIKAEHFELCITSEYLKCIAT